MAQDGKKKVKLIGKTTVLVKGKDPNIKSAKSTDVIALATKTEESDSLGKGNKGGGFCKVNFYNNSTEYMDVYFDGHFKLTVMPLMDIYLEIAKKTNIYGNNGKLCWLYSLKECTDQINFEEPPRKAK